jgi:hypothetical protein
MNDIEKRIRVLLQQYYQGKTTIEEEDLLAQYFATADIPNDLLPDRELFAPQVGISQEFQLELENDIVKAIEREKSEAKGKSARIVRLVATWAAAASVVIVLGVTWLLTGNSAKDMYVDTYDDPYLALQETQRVLALVGSKISMAQAEMQSLEMLQLPNQMLEPVNKLSKNLKHLEKIKTIEKPKEMPFIKQIFEDSSKNQSVQN